MDTEALSRTNQALGNQFVEFVLGLKTNGSAAPDSNQGQESALQLLHTIAGMINAATPAQRDSVRQSALVSPDGKGLVETCFQLTGQECPAIATTDDVELRLLEILRNIWPTLLMPFTGDSFPSPVYVAATSSLRLASFHQLGCAVMEDAILRNLFPGSQDAAIADAHAMHAISSEIYWKSGYGGTVQLSTLLFDILTHIMAMTATSGDISWGSVREQTKEALLLARRLASKSDAELPLYAWLSNISLADEVGRVNTAWGTLRRANRTEMPFLRAALPENGGTEHSAYLLFEGKSQDKIIRIYPPSDPKGLGNNFPAAELTTGLNASQSSIQNLISKVRYSMLLTSTPDIRIATQARGIFRLNPLSFNVPQWTTSNPENPPAYISSQNIGVQIGEAIALDIERWSRRVAGHHPHLDLGMRRILSAAIDRTDPLDGFIDSVMSWENLFGDKQETTFKVCGALARLLQPEDDIKRKQLFSELTKLYNTRSDLVHGAKEPSPHAAYKFRDDALKYALTAMRQAYKFEDLMQLPTSAERAKRVILGI